MKSFECVVVMSHYQAVCCVPLPFLSRLLTGPAVDTLHHPLSSCTRLYFALPGTLCLLWQEGMRAAIYLSEATKKNIFQCGCRFVRDLKRASFLIFLAMKKSQCCLSDKLENSVQQVKILQLVSQQPVMRVVSDHVFNSHRSVG